jgi:hypothetical protein
VLAWEGVQRYSVRRTAVSPTACPE